MICVAGLLDLYEASGKEQYATWAIRLQEKQDELFYDKEGGGYFASAPDPHLLIRMKDAQVWQYPRCHRIFAHDGIMTGRCRTQCGVCNVVQPEQACILRGGSPSRVSRESREHPQVKFPTP